MEPKAKRIRDWKLEMTKEAGGSEPLLKGEQGVPSALGTLLLTMWSHGHMSPHGNPRWCHPPWTGPNSIYWPLGGIPGNVHRDVMAHYCQDTKLTPAIHVQVPVLEPKSSKVLLGDASIFLPHILFSDLAHHYPDQFHNLFGTRDLQSFWKGVEKVKDDRLYRHPICLDERHGAYTNCVQEKQKNNSSLHPMWWCWVPEQGFPTSLELGWAPVSISFPAIPKACTTENTWDPIMEWVTWSLEALLKGYHPEVGPRNEPWKGHPFMPWKDYLSPLEFTGQWYGQCRGTMKCIQTPSTSHTGMQAAHAGTATASSHSVKVPLVKRGKASNL